MGGGYERSPPFLIPVFGATLHIEIVPEEAGYRTKTAEISAPCRHSGTFLFLPDNLVLQYQSLCIGIRIGLLIALGDQGENLYGIAPSGRARFSDCICD